MTFRVTRSAWRDATAGDNLLSHHGSYACSETSSSALGLLMSTKPPFLVEAVDPVFPVADLEVSV